MRSLGYAAQGMRNVVPGEDIRHRALRLSLRELAEFSLEDSPASLSTKAIKAALSVVHVRDPFRDVKKKHTRLALSLYDRLKAMVTRSEDSLRMSLKLAACGNVIYLGTGDSFDLSGEVERASRLDFARDNYGVFLERLRRAERILYIADNAGEIVFDRLVLEELPDAVTVAVKSGPILNDATMRDAVSSGLSEVASLITTGTDELGISLERSSPEFRESFEESDIVIAKGHANFETLDEHPREVFFLLKAKCEVVAKRLGVRVADFVFVRTSS